MKKFLETIKKYDTYIYKYGGDILLTILSFILILILLVVNNVIYYTDYMVQWLPQIQKISAICIVHWLVVMNWKFINLKKELSGKNLTSMTS